MMMACTKADQPCGFRSAYAYRADELQTERQSRKENLLSGGLYKVRDNLNKTYSGSIYTKAYYHMGHHFRSSLDLSIAKETYVIFRES